MDKTKKPFFSVIVPVYNNEKEIRKCIDSILNQTYQDFELILIDDGSADATALICDQAAEQDSRVIVIHKKNEGTAAARNDGLFRASGRYVYYVDADDWIGQRLLQEAAFVFDRPDPPDIFAFGIEMITEEGRKAPYPCFVEPGLYKKERLEREVYCRMMQPRGKKIWMPIVSPYLCDKIISRSLMLGHYCRDTSLFMGEESVCAYECIYFAKQVYFSSLIMYFYDRRSESSMHRRYHEDLFDNNIRLAQYYRTYISRGNHDMELQINRRECKSLRYVIEHELEFGSSVCSSSVHLNKKIKQVNLYPICPLDGLSFTDRCFILLLSFRMQYFILLLKKTLIVMSHFWKKLRSRIYSNRE